MRVLHLWDNYAPGLFDQSFAICREQGIETALACMNLIDGPERPDVASCGASIEPSRRPNLSGKDLEASAHRFLDERAFRRMVRREIARFRPDILHIHYGTTGALARR